MQAGEIKLLRHFQKLQLNNDIKKNLLFENAVKWKNCKDVGGVEEKVIQKLYGNKNKAGKSFEKLKLRLRNDILNILLLQESSIKCRSKHEMAIFECRRFLLQADVLLGRGVYNEGVKLVKKAANIAQKNELYTELLLIDNLCSSHNIIKSGENEHILYSKKIKEMTSLMEKSLFAKYFHDELLACSLFKSNIIQPIEEWRKKLDRIKQDYETSGSIKIGFYYNFSALHFYRHIHQYEKSLEHGLVLSKHSELFEIFKTHAYLGNINRELAKCFLLVNKYDEAIKHANLSLKYFTNDMRNSLSSLEILFFCYTNQNEYKLASDIADKAFSNGYFKKDNFMNSKWWFFRAGIEFKMDEFTKALASLKKCNELFKDKTGWMLACTLFEALCRIESGNLEWFEYRLDGLKKLMQRHNTGQTETHNVRFDIIFRVLKTLNKNNYNFVQTCLDEKDSIKLLSDGDGSYGWYLTGLEPVRFDIWIKEKASIQIKNSKMKSKLVA